MEGLQPIPGKEGGGSARFRPPGRVERRPEEDERREGGSTLLPGGVHEAPRTRPPPLQAGGGVRQRSLEARERVEGAATIWERSRNLDTRLDGVDTDEPIALDSSGIKGKNSGEEEMEGEARIPEGPPRGGRKEQADGIDVGHGGGRIGRKPLVQEAMSKNVVGRVYGDGAYDSRADFDLLASKYRPGHQGQEERVEEGEGELRQEDVRDSAAERLGGMEGGEILRRQVGSGGSVFVHQENLRGVCLGEEVRQHGQGDGDEGIALQHIHADDAARRRIVVQHSSF